jgi:excisionase family DNA binding protein
MDAEPLRVTEAARRLGIPTRELLRLVYEHRIRYVMIDGIAHVPADAIDEFSAHAS